MHVVGDVNSFMGDPMKKNWWPKIEIDWFYMCIQCILQRERKGMGLVSINFLYSHPWSIIVDIRFGGPTKFGMCILWMRERVFVCTSEYHKIKRTYTYTSRYTVYSFQVARKPFIYWFSPILWHQINVYTYFVFIYFTIVALDTFGTIYHIRFGGQNFIH